MFLAAPDLLFLRSPWNSRSRMAPDIRRHLFRKHRIMENRELDQIGHTRAVDLAVHDRFAEPHLAVGQDARQPPCP